MDMPRLRPLLPPLWQARGNMIRFALVFRLFEALLLSPLAAIAGRALSGTPVVDSTALVGFLLSPRGCAAVLFGATTVLTIRLLEHAGLSILTLAAMENAPVTTRRIFRAIVADLPAFARISLRMTMIAAAVAAPPAVVAGWSVKRLLEKHDINYYLAERPPEFYSTAGLAGLAVIAATVAIIWLTARWRWVAQAFLFQGRPVRQAFAESATLSRGARRKLAIASLASVALALALGLAGSWLGNLTAAPLLAATRQGWLPAALTLGLLVATRAIIGGLATMLGSCLDAGYFTAFHRQRLALLGERAALPREVVADTETDAAPRHLPAGATLALAVAMVSAAAAGTLLTADALGEQRQVKVSAHRGGTARAPENTLAAIREAAEAGADFAEVDVQMSKDGALVLTHDSDFSRVAGVARKVWDLPLAEIRAIPVGTNAAPEFRDERVPTLEEALALANGLVHLNLELKFYGNHQPGMTAKVVDAIRKAQMTDQVIVQSLEYEPLQEIRRSLPEIPVGYLLSFNARHPQRLQVDFLSVEQGRLNQSFILSAHRRGQLVHAWTVDRREDMERALDLGIDGLITNQTELAVQVVQQHATLPRLDRATRRIRAWLGY